MVSTRGSIQPHRLFLEALESRQLLSTTIASNPDITGVLGRPTLPAIIAGTSATYRGSVVVAVQNNGDGALPHGEQVTIAIKAHNTGTGEDFVINARPQKTYSVSELGIGKSRVAEVNVRFAGSTLPTGNYVLEALITPVQDLGETNTDNNLVTLNRANQTIGLTVAAPAVDFTGMLGASSVKSTNVGTKGTLNVIVTNSGNVGIHGSQAISFTVVARPAGATDASQDVTLATKPQDFFFEELAGGGIAVVRGEGGQCRGAFGRDI